MPFEQDFGYIDYNSNKEDSTYTEDAGDVDVSLPLAADMLRADIKDGYGGTYHPVGDNDGI